MSALVFIDTNIILDFYRVRGREGGLSIIDHIDNNHERIITTEQVEMEYKKNRQAVIIQAYKEQKTPESIGKPPVILLESKPYKAIQTQQNKLKELSDTLKQRMISVLENPTTKDNVYKVLQRLFKHDYDWNLTRDKKVKYTIRRLACKRFMLGYPPRKDNKLSIGDAINWEWLIFCANKSGDDIIIVSRDSDYGETFDNKSIINDWLSKEFHERVSKKRKLILTSRLSEGFKEAKINVTNAEKRVEEEFLTERQKLRSETRTEQGVFEELLRRFGGAEHTPTSLRQHFADNESDSER